MISRKSYKSYVSDTKIYNRMACHLSEINYLKNGLYQQEISNKLEHNTLLTSHGHWQQKVHDPCIKKTCVDHVFISIDKQSEKIYLYMLGGLNLLCTESNAIPVI